MVFITLTQAKHGPLLEPMTASRQLSFIPLEESLQQTPMYFPLNPRKAIGWGSRLVTWCCPDMPLSLPTMQGQRWLCGPHQQEGPRIEEKRGKMVTLHCVCVWGGEVSTFSWDQQRAKGSTGEPPKEEEKKQRMTNSQPFFAFSP